MRNEVLWQSDQEYVDLIRDLLDQPAVQQLTGYTQHHYSDRLTHSLNVSYRSYRVGKKMGLNTRAIARAGLLHDLFYYDWRETKFSTGTHAYVHPRIALRNALRLTELNDMERDIIVKHMWGATTGMPRYAESVVVSLVDTGMAMVEVLSPLWLKARHPFKVNLNEFYG